MAMFSDKNWEEYHSSKREGKLCYHYCSTHSVLPLRDVLNSHGKGYKSEPNYETATYNWCVKCNQPSIHAAVRDGLSHILYITKYSGQKREYVGCYYIVGYYEIGWTIRVDGRTAIRAKRMCFVPIEHAFEITNDRWHRINQRGKTASLSSLRHATQRIGGELLNEILGSLDKHNAVDSYLRETALLKTEHNPFKSIPSGKIYIINVGANTSSPLQSPLFDDGRFEFVPILETEAIDSKERQIFSDLRQFYFPEKPLLDLFPSSAISAFSQVHNDPEFITFTFGDNVKTKGNLRNMQKGDYLFFLARLVPNKNGKFHHRNALFALVGYLEMDEYLHEPYPALFNSPAFEKNAHVRRWITNPLSFTNFAIFKGSTNSRRFRFAAPFNRKFVDFVPILKADGSPWDWNRTTELGVIGANTRTTRMHINPDTTEGMKSSKRFWQYILDSQKWDSFDNMTKSSC